MEIINELEKLFDLPCNWKSDLNLLKKYKVLEDLEEYIEKLKKENRDLDAKLYNVYNEYL